MADIYITVAELAKRAGVSKQKVYSLRQIFPEHFRTEHNKLKVSSLLIEKIGEQNKISSDIDIQHTTTDNIEQDNIIQDNDNKLSSIFYQNQITFLQQQIIEKDKELAELRQQIIGLLEKQQELTEKALQTTSQQQYLQAVKETSNKTGFFHRLLSRNK